VADHADTLIATDLEPARLNAPSPGACAVIVFHGMGQQVRWETINTLVDTLDRHGYVQKRSVHTRQALFTDGDGKELRLGRAECLIGSPDAAAPAAVDTHIYESYWAPLTEGAAGTRDVVRFLLSAGWDGIRYSFRDFRRHVLGGLRSYGRQGDGLPFAFALAFVLGLIALNLTTAWRVGRYVTADPRPALNAYVTPFAQQTHLLWNLEIVAVVFGALMGAAVLLKRRRGRTPAVLRLALKSAGVFLLVAVPLVAIGIVALMLSQQPAQWVPRALLAFGLSEAIIAVVSWGGAFLLS
jgi:hypothetical protein